MTIWNWVQHTFTMENEKNSEKTAKLGSFRTILPQVSQQTLVVWSNWITLIQNETDLYFEKVLSTIVTAFLLLDVGASNFYSTIIIPALTGLNIKNNPDEFLQMSASEVSWFGMWNDIFAQARTRECHVIKQTKKKQFSFLLFYRKYGVSTEIVWWFALWLDIRSNRT